MGPKTLLTLGGPEEFLSMLEIEGRFLGCLDRGLVTVMTELSSLQERYKSVLKQHNNWPLKYRRVSSPGTTHDFNNRPV